MDVINGARKANCPHGNSLLANNHFGAFLAKTAGAASVLALGWLGSDVNRIVE